MHKHLEILIGRLATDPALQERFAVMPSQVIDELGLELTAVEMSGLVATDSQAFRNFTAALDSRLRKMSPSSKCTLNNNQHGSKSEDFE